VILNCGRILSPKHGSGYKILGTPQPSGGKSR
jgi:hypothetical protein